MNLFTHPAGALKEIEEIKDTARQNFHVTPETDGYIFFLFSGENDLNIILMLPELSPTGTDSRDPGKNRGKFI